MALAYQAETQKVHPKSVAVLGPPGSGKTVYLGVLADMLSRPDHDIHALARGAFSISMQQTTITALAERHFPDKTPRDPENWNWLHCQVTLRKRRKPIELIIPDMSGEAIQNDIDHPGTYPVVQAFLSRSEGLILIIDVQAIEDGDPSQEFFAMKMISMLCEKNGHKKRGWPNRPVVLNFMKADPFGDCFADPTSYAKQHVPGLWQQCKERLGRYAFFASNVVGASTYLIDGDRREQIPLRMEPYGIVEPFQWLVTQLAK